MEQQQLSKAKEKKTIEGICFFCGRPFTCVIPDMFIRKNGHIITNSLNAYIKLTPLFCSSMCESKFRTQQKAIQRESLSLRRPTKKGIKKECPRCGRKFNKQKTWCPLCNERLIFKEVIVYDD